MASLIKLISEGWFGSMLGILGVILSAYFYWRSKRVASLAIQRDTVTLLGGSNATFPNEVEIKFSGVPISRVTAEKIVLWNAGTTTVVGSQIVAADSLRFDLNSGDILKVRVLKATREVNAISIKPISKKVVEIGFDFLDPNDGIAFEILHSGARRDLRLQGTLRGMPRGVRDFGRARSLFSGSLRDRPILIRAFRSTLPMIFFLGITVATYGFFRPQIHTWLPALREPATPDPIDPRVFFVSIGLTYALLPAVFFWIRRRRYPPGLHTEEADDDGKREAESAKRAA